MPIVLSVFLGLLFLQVDDDFVGVHDRCVECIHLSRVIRYCLQFTYNLISFRIGAMFFMIINLALINIPAIDVFIKERAIFV